MPSLQKELLKKIQNVYPKSRSLDDLFAISDILGHKQSLCERKSRILVHSGLVEVIKNEKRQNMAYRAIKNEKVIFTHLPSKLTPQVANLNAQATLDIRLPQIIN